MQEQPQVVNVIPQAQLRQQNATSVEQALRNVPGVTVAIGEGGGGFAGDQFRIRGFEAKGDLYLGRPARCRRLCARQLRN